MWIAAIRIHNDEGSKISSIMNRFSSQSLDNNAELPQHFDAERSSDLKGKLMNTGGGISPNAVISPLSRDIDAPVRYSYEAEFVYSANS